jgi:hypothetical protein
MVVRVKYSVVERSRGWVSLCAVCIMHKETRSVGFLVEPQNQGQRFVNGLASKPLGQFVSGLASTPLGQFIIGLASKPLGRFLPIWPQNRSRWFLLVWPQNSWWQVSQFGP